MDIFTCYVVSVFVSVCYAIDSASDSFTVELTAVTDHLKSDRLLFLAFAVQHTGTTMF